MWFITQCPPPSRSPTLTALLASPLQIQRCWVATVRGEWAISSFLCAEPPVLCSQTSPGGAAGRSRIANPPNDACASGGLRYGHFVGEGRAETLGSAELEVATVTHRHWSDRLGPTLLLDPRWAPAWGLLGQAGWFVKPGPTILLI